MQNIVSCCCYIAYFSVLAGRVMVALMEGLKTVLICMVNYKTTDHNSLQSTIHLYMLYMVQTIFLSWHPMVYIHLSLSLDILLREFICVITCKYWSCWGFSSVFLHYTKKWFSFPNAMYTIYIFFKYCVCICLLQG